MTLDARKRVPFERDDGRRVGRGRLNQGIRRLCSRSLRLTKAEPRCEIEKQISPEIAKWYLAQFQNDLKLARSMHEAGVQMMAGSDSLDPFNFPGPSLHEELKLLTEVGFTPLQALQAATSKPAEFLSATGESGWGRSKRARLPISFCSMRIRSPTSRTRERLGLSSSAENFSIVPRSIKCWPKLAPRRTRQNRFRWTR